MLPPHFWSREEELLVIKGVQIFGYCWSRIAQTLLPHVHAGAIKNKFYKMMGLGQLQMKQDDKGRAYPVYSQNPKKKHVQTKKINSEKDEIDLADDQIIDLLSRFQELVV